MGWFGNYLKAGNWYTRIISRASGIQRSWLILVLAISGFAAITVTGALGGAVAHGPQADPITRFVTSALGLNDQLTTPTADVVARQSPSAAAKKTFTMEEVARHNSQQSCYSVVRGLVYDLTAAITTHPGGADKILAICGRDGTRAFVSKHGGSPRQEAGLEKLKIGVVR